MKAQMVAASADRLGLRRRLQRSLLLLGEFSLGSQDGEPATVMLLEGTTEHWRDNKDQPPVATDERGDVVHVAILPYRSARQQSRHLGRAPRSGCSQAEPSVAGLARGRILSQAETSAGQITGLPGRLRLGGQSELAVPGSAEERIPFGPGEDQRRAFRVA